MENRVLDGFGSPRPDTEVARIKENASLAQSVIYGAGFPLRTVMNKLADEASKSPDGKIVVDAKVIREAQQFIVAFDAWVSWCSRGCPGKKPSGFDY